MNRRQLLCAGASSLVALALRTTPLRAAGAAYDLVIKGGRVIDPASKLDKTADVAIAGGKIAAVGANITANGAQIVDAGGKLVVPGLIDIHTHAAEAAGGPQKLPDDGVT